jgi:hypothetical protein
MKYAATFQEACIFVEQSYIFLNKARPGEALIWESQDLAAPVTHLVINDVNGDSFGYVF